MSNLLYNFTDNDFGDYQLRVKHENGDPIYFLTDGFNEEEIIFLSISYEPIFRNYTNGNYSFYNEKLLNFLTGFSLGLKESSR